MLPNVRFEIPWVYCVGRTEHHKEDSMRKAKGQKLTADSSLSIADIKFYEKLQLTSVGNNHFYKMFRYKFFDKFIFTIDIYPSQLTFGFMTSYTGGKWWQIPHYQWNWLVLK